jgi:PPOX class probable F420-dependent enzyme
MMMMMTSTIPAELRDQKYVSLSTFRKNGVAVPTPVWFAEENEKLYVMTRGDSGKIKRIRANPVVNVAPSTIRGKVTGHEFPGRARVLPEQDWPHARELIRAKYWLARLPFMGGPKNVYVEISF